MLNLAVDIGNTVIKYALFAENQLVETGHAADEQELLTLIAQRQIINIIVSSVRKEQSEIGQLVPHNGRYVKLNYQTPVPVTNNYETPHTLGMDRLAAVVGANYLLPELNCLVIDAGTCITCDVIDKEKNYRGGSISPGLDMKFRAMHTFTGKLPLVEQTIMDVPLTGRNTIDAMRSGVLLGTVAELSGRISAYKTEFPELAVVLCGGDAAFFETNLKATIFVVPELVLIGLNRILNYNA